MLSKLKLILFLTLTFQMILFSQFAGGSGTVVDPYQVSTAEQLSDVRDFRGSNFIQTNDIDLGVSPWNEGEGWEPIGIESHVFGGYYNGNNYQIKNLTINRPEQDFIGLFGFCVDLSLENIELININIIGRNSVGGLIGYGFGPTNGNCYLSGIISGVSEVGGIVGTTDGYYSIMNCYTVVDVSGTNNVGGLVGISISNGYIYIHKSYAIGNVSGDENVGGLVGCDETTNVVFSYWNTETSGQDTSAGGEGRTTSEMTYDFSKETYEYWDFDNIWTEDLDSLNNGYPYFQSEISEFCPSAPANLTAKTQNGEFSVELSWNNPDTLINGDLLIELDAVYLYRDFDIIQTYINPTAGEFISITDTVLVNGEYTYKVVGENSQGFGIIARLEQPIGMLFASGTGTESDPFQVATANHLYNIRYYTGIDSIYFKQIDDINLDIAPWNEGKGWIPIGNEESLFMGSYKSKSFYERIYEIDGLTINDTTLNNTGLFGNINNADLDSMKLKNISIVGNNSCGALAGSATGSRINNCFVISGDISGAEEVGGLIGISLYNTISQSYSSHPNYLVSVSGTTLVGGFSGLNWSKVKDCYS
ncbi:MAG: hypothetical protein PF638_02855 [Candidatus Delongbacteria bacterium]|jgi:hypothetical protein|nr:hypothetical protein [Candidatus Delongbacteria bacterium]